MEFILSLAHWRSGLALGGLLVLLGIENKFPFKTCVEPKLRRYWINFFIAGSNALIVNVLLGGIVVAYTRMLYNQGFGLMSYYGVGPFWNIVFSIVFLDFATYAWHMAYHRWPFLWRLHRVHHSDRDLDVTTASRFHLGEILLSTVYRLFLYPLWGPSVSAAALFEMLLLLAAQFQHSNLKLPGFLEDTLRLWFVTPDMHRVHHSEVRDHTNSNYSTVFSVWDKLFGTYRMDVSQEQIKIGLPEYQTSEDVSLGKLLTMPLGPACRT
ncbi:MAG: sterol desaturase family protein [Elusimicrobia bacterium]|nr:sterol desaturase family protein [Elusimicrobiota bacterium]